MSNQMYVDWYIWDDVGYTEGSAETPYRRADWSDLRSPDRSILNQRVPPVKDLFSYVRLNQSYVFGKTYKYLKMVLHYPTSGSTAISDVFYGWIDKVDYLSETVGGTNDSAMIGISWHVDPWRTYLNKVDLQRGVVLRRKALTGVSNPPQSPSYYNRYVKSKAKLVSRSDDLWWVLFTYILENSDGDVTGVRHCCFPLEMKGVGYIELNSDGSGKHAPSLLDFLSGKWDEDMGLTPSRIVSAFLSPIAPVTYTKTTSTSDAHTVISMSTANWTTTDAPHKTTGSIDYTCFMEAGLTDYQGAPRVNYELRTSILSPTVSADDVTSYVLTGFSGEVIGQLPFGKALSYLDYRLVVSATNAFIQIRFRDDDAVTPATVDGYLTGITFNIPLIPIDVSQNSYSEYNYTGAREYDRAQRAEQLRYQRESELVDSLTSVGIGAATTAVGGATGGAVGALGGAGGLVSGLSSLAGLGIHTALGLEEGHNSNLDSMKSRYMAKQSEGLQYAGEGFDVFFHGQDITLNVMKIDEYSENQYNAEIAQFGYKVCEPTADCDSLVDVSGPLQIDDLNIKCVLNAYNQYESVPIEAIQYIKSRLKRGVKLV